MTKPPVNVFVAGAPVGHLARSAIEEDTILFGYREGTSAENAVSLTMPVRPDHYDAMGGLLPLFEMNLPEGMLRERLRLQFAKTIPEFDDLDLLTLVGASQIGRLRYARENEIDPRIPTQDLDEILTYAGSADLFQHLLEKFATHSGISGVQPKVLVRGTDTPDLLTHRGATHIVKTFDPREYPELAANELICTAGATAAGIRTATLRLSGNRQFLVVDRFDLLPDGDYLGIEDFCVLDARRAHGRYDGSYESVAQRMRDFVSPGSLPEALEQFALTVVYACTIGNGDAHRKNFSVLYRHVDDRVSLAPAYDLVSTQVYLPDDTLALTLGGTKAFPQRAQLLTFVRQVTGKSPKAAGELLERVHRGAEAALSEAAAHARCHADAARLLESFARVIHAGIDRLSR